MPQLTINPGFLLSKEYPCATINMAIKPIIKTRGKKPFAPRNFISRAIRKITNNEKLVQLLFLMLVVADVN